MGSEYYNHCSSQVDLKIIVLGDGSVGKTSLIHRYTNNEFKETISVNLILKLDNRCGSSCS